MQARATPDRSRNSSVVAGTLVDGSRDVALADIDPADAGDLPEADAPRHLDELTSRLLELQGLAQASERNGVLIVLQGMDASGKDLTIQQALGASNPEAIRVKHFGGMTEEEELHDFLWRAHLVAPKRGEWVVFDRSYYEQLIEPQLEDDASDAEIEERFRDVRDFERILRNGGTIVVKVFLHVSEDEQERRLEERMASDETAWKISARDWIARRRWDEYMRAWERTMNATAAPDAAWLVVPADRDWVRNVVVAQALVDRLEPYRPEWLAERDRIGDEKRAEAREEAPEDVRART